MTNTDQTTADGRFTPWPAWSRADRPERLVHYVQYGVVARLLGAAAQVGGLPMADLPGAAGPRCGNA